MVVARSTTREVSAPRRLFTLRLIRNGVLQELLQELYDTPRFKRYLPERYRLRMPEWTRIRCGLFPRPPSRGDFLKKATIWGQFEKDSPLYLQLGGKIERLLPAVVGDHLAVVYSW